MEDEKINRELLDHQYYQGLKSLSQSFSHLKMTEGFLDLAFSPLKWTLATRQ